VPGAITEGLHRHTSRLLFLKRAARYACLVIFCGSMLWLSLAGLPTFNRSVCLTEQLGGDIKSMGYAMGFRMCGASYNLMTTHDTFHANVEGYTSFLRHKQQEQELGGTHEQHDINEEMFDEGCASAIYWFATEVHHDPELAEQLLQAWPSHDFIGPHGRFPQLYTAMCDELRIDNRELHEDLDRASNVSHSTNSQVVLTHADIHAFTSHTGGNSNSTNKGILNGGDDDHGHGHEHNTTGGGGNMTLDAFFALPYGIRLRVNRMSSIGNEVDARQRTLDAFLDGEIGTSRAFERFSADMFASGQTSCPTRANLFVMSFATLLLAIHLVCHGAYTGVRHMYASWQFNRSRARLHSSSKGDNTMVTMMGSPDWGGFGRRYSWAASEDSGSFGSVASFSSSRSGSLQRHSGGVSRGGGDGKGGDGGVMGAEA